MSLVPDSLRPSELAARLGMLDALPNAVARTSGMLRLFRAAVTQEPAPVAPTPADVVEQLGAARLIRYRRDEPARFRRPVLLCPSVINRHYVLDLKEDISVVKVLLEGGHDVFIIDWGDPGEAELNLDLADFIVGRLRHFVDRVNEEAGSDDLHLVGHCLGGTMATALVAVDSSGVATLTNLTAPMDFHDDGILSAWTRAPFFDPRSLADALGHIPAWLTQPSFMILRPMGQPVKALRLFQNLGNERFLEFFRCLETWINDNVDIPKGFYIDLIEKLYRQNALLKGELVLAGQPAVLEEITLPALTVCAKQDHIVPPRSAVAGHERLGSKDKRLEVYDGGHIGVVVGGLARRNLWPLLLDWFQTHAAPAGGDDKPVKKRRSA